MCAILAKQVNQTTSNIIRLCVLPFSIILSVPARSNITFACILHILLTVLYHQTWYPSGGRQRQLPQQIPLASVAYLLTLEVITLLAPTCKPTWYEARRHGYIYEDSMAAIRMITHY